MISKIYDAIVVGSGPSGIAVVHKLLSKNKKILLIDGGEQLEDEIAREIEKFRYKETLSDSEKNILKGEPEITAKGIPIKLAYGSYFPYANAEEELKINLGKIDHLPSLAVGGLSTVWGGSTFPYRDADLIDWPIKLSDLTEHYEFVLNFQGIAGIIDELEQDFPIYSKKMGYLEKSNQAKKILENWNLKKDILHRKGFSFGTSRLAIRSNLAKCIYCGCCLFGCPRRLIYNSGDDISKFYEDENFTYASNLIVENIEEKNQICKLRASFRGKKNEEIVYSARRVYLGAGVLSTAKIMLNSLCKFDEKILMLDSQYLMIPALLLDNCEDIKKEKLHTLAQLFFGIQDDKLTPKRIHFQLYTYNSMINDLFERKFRRLYPHFEDLIEKKFLGRLIAIQGFLPSVDSHSAQIWLDKKTNQLESKLIINRNSKILFQKIQKYLFKNSLNTGFLPFPFTSSLGNFGRSFHTGGTFPMTASEKLTFNQSDIYGRVADFERIHIVDSSVFPSIPSGAITLSIMANASRIASFYDD